jgi:NADPH-dependent curcumin reductase CurA
MSAAWSPGDVLAGGAVTRVIAPRNTASKEGEFVQHGFGWRDHLISNGQDLAHVDVNLAPLSTSSSPSSMNCAPGSSTR